MTILLWVIWGSNVLSMQSLTTSWSSHVGPACPDQPFKTEKRRTEGLKQCLKQIADTFFCLFIFVHCYTLTVVNMPLSRLFWNVLQASDPRRVNIFKKQNKKTITFLRLNDKYLVFVVNWTELNKGCVGTNTFTQALWSSFIPKRFILSEKCLDIALSGCMWSL